MTLEAMTMTRKGCRKESFWRRASKTAGNEGSVKLSDLFQLNWIDQFQWKLP